MLKEREKGIFFLQIFQLYNEKYYRYIVYNQSKQ